MTKARLAYLAAALALAGGFWYFTRHGGPVPVAGGPDCGSSYGNCQSGYRCIQKCGPPVARDNDPPPGYYCELNAVADQPRNCPICLASNTTIATPSGNVNVRDVRVGMRVWSVDGLGRRIESTVIRVSRAQTPQTHQVVHVMLSDGREAWISPNHPTVKGTPVGSLRVGESYDGATVWSAERVPYWDDATYDLLPDSATGRYWANDIMMDSTLMKGGGFK